MEDRTHMIRKIIVTAGAVFFMMLGVMLSTKAVLGTSPISSVPFVLSSGTGISLGMTTMIMNIIFVILGIAIMGKGYKLSYLGGILMIAMFSVLCDIFTVLLQDLIVTDYVTQWILIIASVVILAFGISLEVAANLSMMPGEYLVAFISYRTKIEFGKVKVMFDIVIITIATLLSFFYFGMWEFIGVREGTVFAAVAVGFVVRFYTKYEKKWLYEWVGHQDITTIKK